MTAEQLQLEQLLDVPEVAKLLNIKIATLAQWRMAGTGPKFLRFGHRSVRYRTGDVIAFIERSAATTTKS